MAWIELHQSMPGHKKTLRLADALNIIEAQAVGHMAMFWLWALDNSPDGSLADVTPRIIARAAGWPGDPDEFCSALVHAGFLDQDADGTLYIHDWDDYAGRLIEKREKNKQRMREARAANRAANVQRTCDERATHVPRTNDARAGATIPYHTIPNHDQLLREITSDEIRVPIAGDTSEPAQRLAESASPSPQEIANLWNEICGDVLPKCEKMTDKRRKHIKARLAESRERHSLDWWHGYFSRIRASPFCCGQNDRGWRATFEWAICSEDNVVKVLEGKYDRKRGDLVAVQRERGGPIAGVSQGPDPSSKYAAVYR